MTRYYRHVDKQSTSAVNMKKQLNTALEQNLTGLIIRRMRMLAGISQSTLAHLANTDPSYLSAVERGQRKISLSKFQEVCDALNIDAATCLSMSQLLIYSASLPHPRRN